MTQFETHKFGGTSLGDKQRIKAAADIIRTERDPSCMSLVVASAIGGATNALLKAVDEGVLPTLVTSSLHTLCIFKIILCSALKRSGRHVAVLDELEAMHVAIASTAQLKAQIHDSMKTIRELVEGVFLLREATPRSRDAIASFGELFSAPLLAEELGCPWIDTREVRLQKRVTCFFSILTCASPAAKQSKKVIRTNDKFGDAQPLFGETRDLLRARVASLPPTGIVVVTGFIGSTVDGLTTTLGRSGSDFTATIIAGSKKTVSI